jgi:hypothetical protein
VPSVGTLATGGVRTTAVTISGDSGSKLAGIVLIRDLRSVQVPLLIDRMMRAGGSDEVRLGNHGQVGQTSRARV